MNKTLFAALAAATAAGLALPAAAQDYGRHGDYGRYEDRDGGGYRDARNDHGDRGDYAPVNARQADLQRRIEWGVRRGTLDRGEAYRLQAEAREIARLEAGYRVNGLNSRERADLDRRLDRLETHIARETHDRDYGSGYGGAYRR